MADKNMEIDSDELRKIFQQCFAASRDVKQQFVDLILSLASPEQLIEAAWAEFYKKGNGERLSLAADILIHYGARAFPVLRELGETLTPNAEYFIDALIAFSDDQEISRDIDVIILGWLNHPHRDVRQRVTEVFPDLRLEDLANKKKHKAIAHKDYLGTSPEGRAVKLITKFSKDIEDCDSINDYYDLVVSLFIFNELVRSHVLDVFAEDGDGPSALEGLEEAGIAIAKKVLSNNEMLSNIKNKKFLN